MVVSWDLMVDLPSGNDCYIAIEHADYLVGFPSSIVIFYSYIKLPEGTGKIW